MIFGSVFFADGGVMWKKDTCGVLPFWFQWPPVAGSDRRPAPSDGAGSHDAPSIRSNNNNEKIKSSWFQ